MWKILVLRMRPEVAASHPLQQKEEQWKSHVAELAAQREGSLRERALRLQDFRVRQSTVPSNSHNKQRHTPILLFLDTTTS